MVEETFEEKLNTSPNNHHHSSSCFNEDGNKNSNDDDEENKQAVLDGWCSSLKNDDLNEPVPLSVQFCVCADKYERACSELCDRCANRYHVECAGDECIRNSYERMRRERSLLTQLEKESSHRDANESIGFVCFVCRRVEVSIRKYESELKAYRRWDSDCEIALSLKYKDLEDEKQPKKMRFCDEMPPSMSPTSQQSLEMRHYDQKAITKSKQPNGMKSSSQASLVSNGSSKSSHSINNNKLASPNKTKVKSIPFSDLDKKKILKKLVRDLGRRIDADAEMALTARTDDTRVRQLAESILNEYITYFSSSRHRADKFHKRWTSFKSNLVDVRNKTFFRKILSGSIRPCDLPKMSSHDMMDESVRNERLREERAKLMLIQEANDEHNRLVLEHKRAVNEKMGLSSLDHGLDFPQTHPGEQPRNYDCESSEEKEKTRRWHDTAITKTILTTTITTPTPITSSRSDIEMVSDAELDIHVVGNMQQPSAAATRDDSGELGGGEMIEELVESIGDVLPVLTLRPEDLLTSPSLSEMPNENTPDVSFNSPSLVDSTTTTSLYVPSFISSLQSVTSHEVNQLNNNSSSNTTGEVKCSKRAISIGEYQDTRKTVCQKTSAIVRNNSIEKHVSSPSSSIDDGFKLPAYPYQPSPSIVVPKPTEFRVNVEIELQSRFSVMTVWHNVIEIVCKQSTFGLTPKIVDQLRASPRLQLRVADEENNASEHQLIAEFWKVLHVKQRHYVVFEVEASRGVSSFQWLNRDTKLRSDDEVVFTTLCELVNTVRSVPCPQRPESFRTKCVRCSVPKELRSLVDFVFLLWVSEIKGRNDLNKYKIPLDRNKNRLLGIMFLRSSAVRAAFQVQPLYTVSASSATSSHSTTSTLPNSSHASKAIPPTLIDRNEAIETKQLKTEPVTNVRDPRRYRYRELKSESTIPKTQD